MVKNDIIVLLVLLFLKIAFSSNNLSLDDAYTDVPNNSQNSSFSSAADTAEIIVYNNINVGVLKDTTICIDDSVKLVCSGDKVFSYEWIDDDTGEVVWKGRDFYISPRSTKTYTLNLYYFTGELIKNSAFSKSTLDFDSEYKRPKTINNRCLWPEGLYVVGDKPSKYHTNFRDMGDHTSGSGDMMIINGARSKGVKVWGQWIDVSPNTIYAFSTWAVSVCSGSPADLRFTIDGKLLGEQFQLEDHTKDKPAEWAQFYALWNSGSNTRVYISLENMTIIASGNDFAIDDISFASMTKVSRKVIVRVRPKITYSDIRDTVVCAGTDFQVEANAYGSDLNYKWYHDGALITGADSILSIKSVDECDKGLYRCDVEGFCGSESISFNLDVLRKTFVKPLRDTCVCIGDDYTIIIDALGDELEYSWLHNDTLIGEDSNQLKLTSLDFNDAGEYKCVVSGTCGDTTVMMSLDVIGAPVLQSDLENVSLKQGESIDIKMVAEGGGTSFMWLLGADTLTCNTANLSINNIDIIDEGVYTCVVSNECGEDRKSVRLSVVCKTDIINNTLDTAICENESIVLFVEAGGRNLIYNWYHNGKEVGTDNYQYGIANAKASQSGLYKCVVRGDNGSDTCNITLTVNPLLSVNIDFRDTIGYCETELLVQGGSPLGGKYIVDGKYSDSLYYKKGVSEHTIVYEVTDNLTSCSSRDTVKVFRADNPYVILEDSVKIGSCNNYEIKPKVSTGDYIWEDGSYLDDVNKLNAVFTPGETSYCRLEITDKYGCQATDSIKIIVAKEPRVTGIQDTVIGICNELELNCEVCTEGDYSLSWNPKEFFNKSGTEDVGLLNRKEGIKFYTVSVTDEYGCIDTDTIKVEVKGPPELGEDKYCCYGDTLNVDLEEYNSVVWKDGSEDKIRNLTNAGEYFVSVCDKFGCKDSVMYRVVTLPKINLKDTVIYQGESIDIEPVVESDDGISSIMWQDGSIGYYYNASRKGVYSVEVENTYGCKFKKSMFLDVKSAIIAAPNAFLPDSHGENNRFYLKDLIFQGNFEMIIFNRWGTDIYRTNEIGYKGGWPGDYKGVRCKPGAYVWVAYVDGKLWGKGHITLVR